MLKKPRPAGDLLAFKCSTLKKLVYIGALCVIKMIFKRVKILANKIFLISKSTITNQVSYLAYKFLSLFTTPILCHLLWCKQLLCPRSPYTSHLPPSTTAYTRRLRLICVVTRAETTFRLSARRTSPFKSAGASVQSTTGSRDLRISGNNARCTMFRGSVKADWHRMLCPCRPDGIPMPCR